jgi:hypothetical protein
MGYILKNTDNYQLISFLTIMPFKKKDNEQFRQYMLLKSSMYWLEANGSLVDFHLKCIDDNDGSEYQVLQHVMYLFEEIKMYSGEQNVRNAYIRAVIDNVLKEQPKKFEAGSELQLPRKHFFIGLLMIYWQLEVTSDDMSYLKLLKLIINGKRRDFSKSFETEMIKMAEDFTNVYDLDSMYDNRHQESDQMELFHYHEKYITNFLFVFLYAALVTDQENIMDIIFKHEHFLITEPTFPLNMVPKNIHQKCMIKFLNSKYELGRDTLPGTWVTTEALKLFLDSRITQEGDECRIDAKFMLPYYNHNSPDSTDPNDLILNEDPSTLKWIISKRTLKPLVVHPVLESIIRLKIQKYARILHFDELIFMLMHMLFIGGLLFLYNCNGTSTDFTPKPLHWLVERNTYIHSVTAYILFGVRMMLYVIREYFWYNIDASAYLNNMSWLNLATFFWAFVLFFVTTIHQAILINMSFVVVVLVGIINLVLTIGVVLHRMYSKIWKPSKESELINLATTYIQLAKRLRIFHALNELKNNSFSKKLIYKLIKGVCNQYPCVHRLQYIFIDLTTFNVYIPKLNINNLNISNCIKHPIKLNIE